MYIILLGIVVLFMVAGEVYDVTVTEKGLRAGVAVESFTWLVGAKPTAVALYLRDTLIMSLAVAPTILCFHYNLTPFAYGFLTAPVVDGIRHVLGARAWKKLLK